MKKSSQKVGYFDRNSTVPEGFLTAAKHPKLKNHVAYRATVYRTGECITQIIFTTSCFYVQSVKNVRLFNSQY